MKQLGQPTESSLKLKVIFISFLPKDNLCPLIMLLLISHGDFCSVLKLWAHLHFWQSVSTVHVLSYWLLGIPDFLCHCRGWWTSWAIKLGVGKVVGKKISWGAKTINQAPLWTACLFIENVASTLLFSFRISWAMQTTWSDTTPGILAMVLILKRHEGWNI